MLADATVAAHPNQALVVSATLHPEPPEAPPRLPRQGPRRWRVSGHPEGASGSHRWFPTSPSAKSISHAVSSDVQSPGVPVQPVRPARLLVNVSRSNAMNTEKSASKASNVLAFSSHASPLVSVQPVPHFVVPATRTGVAGPGPPAVRSSAPAESSKSQATCACVVGMAVITMVNVKIKIAYFTSNTQNLRRVLQLIFYSLHCAI